MYAPPRTQSVDLGIEPWTKKRTTLAQAQGGWGAARWAYGTFSGRSHMNGTEKAMKAVGRQARLEHSGASTPDLWRPNTGPNSPDCPNVLP